MVTIFLWWIHCFSLNKFVSQHGLRKTRTLSAGWLDVGRVTGCRQGDWVSAGWLDVGRVTGCRQGDWVSAGWLGVGRVTGCRQGDWVSAGWLGVDRVTGWIEDRRCWLWDSRPRRQDFNFPPLNKSWTSST